MRSVSGIKTALLRIFCKQFQSPGGPTQLWGHKTQSHNQWCLWSRVTDHTLVTRGWPTRAPGTQKEHQAGGGRDGGLSLQQTLLQKPWLSSHSHLLVWGRAGR